MGTPGGWTHRWSVAEEAPPRRRPRPDSSATARRPSPRAGAHPGSGCRRRGVPGAAPAYSSRSIAPQGMLSRDLVALVVVQAQRLLDEVVTVDGPAIVAGQHLHHELEEGVVRLVLEGFEGREALTMTILNLRQRDEELAGEPTDAELAALGHRLFVVCRSRGGCAGNENGGPSPRAYASTLTSTQALPHAAR